MSLSPNGKLLAFVNSDENKNPAIYIVDKDDGSQKKLTVSGTREPSFSPDGKFITFVKIDTKNRLGDEVYVIPVTGGKPVLICDKADVVKSPIWSPDGSMVAFLARKYEKGWANNSNELWIAELDKRGKPSGLITRSELDNSTISMLAGWSQDHKIGMWLSSPDKNLLYTVPTKGGQAMQLTTKGSWMPSWSPDGKYLYFDGINTDKWGGVESVPVIGGVITRIPIKSKYSIQPAVPTGGISLSPDGERIVFAGNYFNINESDIRKELEGSHIMTIPVVGGTPVQLTSNPLADGYPVWSPDGRNIAFLRRKNKTENNTTKSFGNVYTIPAEGGTPKQVTSEKDKVTFGRIDWSPDGNWIGFFSADNTIKIVPVEGGISKVVANDVDIHPHNGLSFSNKGDKITYSHNGRIQVIDLNGGNPVEVTTGIDAVHTMPSWSPDGEKIAFCTHSKGETDLWFMENFLPLENLSQESGIAEEPEGIKIKQIWKSPYLEDIGSVSFDGQFRSFVDWGVGNVALHNLVTDEKKILTNDASLGDSTHFAESTVISKNGDKIAYSWWNPYNTNDLKLIEVDNPTPRLLYRKKGEEIYPMTWLSDNELVVTRFIPDTKTTHMVSFNVLDNTEQVLKTFNPFHFPRIACSPDRKYIVYNFANERDNGNSDINIMLTDGNGDIPLITHPANDKVFGWVPGRKEFLFLSDRSGTWDLWAATLDETKLSGPAKRIYANIGEVKPMGFTENGTCYVGFSKRNFYSSITPFNKETGEINLESGKSMKGSNYGITWSPDGQYLAYAKFEDDISFIIRDLKTGEEHQPLNKRFAPLGHSWSPDGNSILFIGVDENQLQTEGYKGEIFLLDMGTGQTEEILQLSDYEYNVPEDDAFPLSGLEWFPDGKSFYYLFFKDRLVKHDLETGKDKILLKYPGFTRGVLDLSPDGTSLLFGLEYPGEKKSCLFTMPAEGGKEYEVCTVQEADNFNVAFWSPDGKYIYFVELLENIKTNLWRVKSTGGNPEKVWSSENRLDIFDIHPDGKQVAFSIRERTTQVRVIENLGAELSKVFKKNE